MATTVILKEFSNVAFFSIVFTFMVLFCLWCVTMAFQRLKISFKNELMSQKVVNKQ